MNGQESIISVQDLRSSLASITDRAEHGESFVVVRSSKPAFRIVPMQSSSPLPTLASLVERIDAASGSNPLTDDEIVRVVREVRKGRPKHRASTAQSG